jgi:hypothetical protein
LHSFAKEEARERLASQRGTEKRERGNGVNEGVHWHRERTEKKRERRWMGLYIHPIANLHSSC